jgi:molybdate transport system substrate-binding protein
MRPFPRGSLCLVIFVGLIAIPAVANAAETTIRVLAAGSLRAAMTQIVASFTGGNGGDGALQVQTTYGSSGVLRQRIERGETADLFASADMASPLALARAGRAASPVLFARNQLCALVRPRLTVTTASLLETMLDPTVKLGTSTPHADPAGDYTWAMFAKAETRHPGSQIILQGKALQLMGGAQAPAPPTGQDVFAWNEREGRADLFIAYCSGGQVFRDQLPGSQVVPLPDELSTGADYGLAVLATNNPSAERLALFILSQDGQTILARNGFVAPLLSDAAN